MFELIDKEFTHFLCEFSMRGDSFFCVKFSMRGEKRFFIFLASNIYLYWLFRVTLLWKKSRRHMI